MPFSIKIQGVEKFGLKAAQLRRMRIDFRERLYKQAELFGLDTIRHIHDQYMSGPKPLKLGPVTGELRRRTRSKTTESSNKISVRFGNPMAYAAIHEFGGPVNRKGKFIFQMRARPYIRPGVKDMVPNFKEKVAALLRQMAQEGLSGGK